MSLYNTCDALCSNCGGVTSTFMLRAMANGGQTEIVRKAHCKFCNAPLAGAEVKAYSQLISDRRDQRAQQARQ